MSGGSLNYFYCDLENHIGDFDDKELDDLVRDLAKLFHEREWFLSSDTGRGSWEEARNAFKEKWFGENSREIRVEKYMNDIREEVFKSFGLSRNYCKNCKSWKPEKVSGSVYGTCEFHKGCLMHRSESCDKFSAREV